MCILWGQSTCKWCRFNHRSHWQTTGLNITGPLRMELVMTALIASASHDLTSSSLTFFCLYKVTSFKLKKIVWCHAEFSCLFYKWAPFVMLNSGVPLREVLCAYLGVDLLSGAAAVRDQQEDSAGFCECDRPESLKFPPHFWDALPGPALRGHCVAEQRWIQWALSRPAGDSRDVC